MFVSVCNFGKLLIAAIATAAADGGTFTEFTPAILSGGYFVESRSAGGNVERLGWHVNRLTHR